MPTLFSAKDIVEESLKKIGRFPSTQDQADANDLVRGLRALELVLQDFFGSNDVTSAWGSLLIPIVAGVMQYPLSQYSTNDGVQFVYAAELINNADATWRPTPLDIVTEKKFFEHDLHCTGLPCRLNVDKGVSPIMQINPILGADVADGTYSVLIQIQTFATQILLKGIGAKPIDLRPTYYLWAINRLAYELGTGTLRYLPETQLSRLQKDYQTQQTLLEGYDANENSTETCTEPWGQ